MSAAVLDLYGRSVPMTVRVSSLAQRMSLRVDPKTMGVVVVLPRGAPPREAVRFAYEHADWITQRLKSLPIAIALTDGEHVPYLGVEHRIRHRPEAGRGVWVEEGEIHVSGRAEHLPRRLTDWLKKEARRVIAAESHALADRLGKTVGRISLRDTRSRWGSCSAKGDLSFSWRLILAPPEVRAYVAAHEVAHLVELNHSPRYWAVVDGLVDNRREARAWLRRHGPLLHRYGP